MVTKKQNKENKIKFTRGSKDGDVNITKNVNICKTSIF